jgi:hypothetical protein
MSTCGGCVAAGNSGGLTENDRAWGARREGGSELRQSKKKEAKLQRRGRKTKTPRPWRGALLQSTGSRLKESAEIGEAMVSGLTADLAGKHAAGDFATNTALNNEISRA